MRPQALGSAGGAGRASPKEPPLGRRGGRGTKDRGGNSILRPHTAVLAPVSRPSHNRHSLRLKHPRSQSMNAQAVEALMEKLKSLPPEQRAEVEDFVDFLKARKERARDAAAQRLGEAFAKLDALNLPPLTPEEVQAEIDAARAERRARHAD